MKLTVRPQTFEISEGSTLDTSAVVVHDVLAAERAAMSLNLGIKVRASNDGNVTLQANDLKMDTPIETQCGTMPLREVIQHPEFAAKKHMRCQAPFRESSSYAAFVSLDGNGKPFVHDSGTGINHRLVEQWMSEQFSPLFDVESSKATRFITKTPKPMRWMISGVIPLGIVATLIAPGGTGKSMFCLQLGISVATGRTFANVWEVGESGGALLLMAEDDEEELHRRIFSIAGVMGLPDDQSLDNLHIVSLVGQDTLLTTQNRETRELEQTNTLERLIVAAKQVANLKLIVIDPISRYRGGDENFAADTTRFIQAAERLQKETGATVMLVHHTNKGAANSKEASQGAARGSSALTDGVRLQMQLTALSEKARKSWGLTEDDARRHIAFAVTKSNYTAPQSEILLHRGEGGYLSKAEALPHVKAPDRVDGKILDLIKKQAEKGEPYSAKKFRQQFAGLDKALGVSDDHIRKRLEVLKKSGAISEKRFKMYA